MNQDRSTPRSLEDISHYFLTQEKKPLSPAPEAELVSQRHFFLLGSQSAEARALLASNLACEWNTWKASVELIEEEGKMPNAQFLMGSLLSERKKENVVRLNGDSSIEFSPWSSSSNGKSYAGKSVLWNLSLPAMLKSLSSLSEAPRVLVVLEKPLKKLIETYLEVRQVVARRPDTLFYAVVYGRENEEASLDILAFFQKTTRKFLNLEIRNGAYLQKDLSLAKSILSQMPVVLFAEEGIPAKKSLKELAKTLWQK